MFIHMECDRCREQYDEKDMRGPVCAWCAADLEKAAQTVGRAS